MMEENSEKKQKKSKKKLDGSGKVDLNERKNVEGRDQEKKGQKKKKVKADGNEDIVESENADGNEDIVESENANEEREGRFFAGPEGHVEKVDKNVEEKKRRKRKREEDKGGLDEGASLQDITQLTESGKQVMENKNGERLEELEEFDEGGQKKAVEKAKRKKRKRQKSEEINSSSAASSDILAKENNIYNADSTGKEEYNNVYNKNTKGKCNKEKSVKNSSQDSTPEKSPKKVRFAENIEVFHLSDVAATEMGNSEDTLVRGKRFSKAENEILKQAVYKYIEDKCLGEKGLNMLLDCRHYPEVRNCWKEIATCIPYRPRQAVYVRAQCMFQGPESHKRVEEEYANVKNGNIKGKTNKAKSVENGSQNSKPEKGPTKVRFAENIEVFPSSDAAGSGKGNNEDTLVRGKRFTKEEDEIVKQAVYKYIEANCLGDEGLNMVLNCRTYPEVRNCWKEIAKCIPYRPRTTIYRRAQILFRRSERREWSEEDYERVREFYEHHGPRWKALADELGKHRTHVCLAWHRIKFGTPKKGRWSQEEYQTLFELVNMSLRMKIHEEKISKWGMLRDNIPWTAISDKLSTRHALKCCRQWYSQLTSPMVAEGKWSDADDYRLINALYQLDASCNEDVNWDNLLDHRSGEVCRKRWNQMVLHIGHRESKSFAEQVEVLAKRYVPDLVGARVAWDNKPVVQ